MSIIRGLFISPVYWFLILLFFISFLMSVCQLASNQLKWKSEIMCSLMAVILFVIQVLLKPNVLSLHIIYIHFFFYTLGWYMRKYEDKVLKSWMIIPAFFGFVVLGWFYQRGAIPSILSFIPPSFYFLVSGLVGSACFLLLFRSYFNYSLPLLGGIGRLTLGVYVIHLIICGACESLLSYVVDSIGKNMGITIMFIMISFVSVVSSYLLKKGRLTRYVIGLK